MINWRGERISFNANEKSQNGLILIGINWWSDFYQESLSDFGCKVNMAMQKMQVGSIAHKIHKNYSLPNWNRIDHPHNCDHHKNFPHRHNFPHDFAHYDFAHLDVDDNCFRAWLERLETGWLGTPSQLLLGQRLYYIIMFMLMMMLVVMLVMI